MPVPDMQLWVYHGVHTPAGNDFLSHFNFEISSFKNLSDKD
jgi:hypothetical protein